MRNRHEPNLSRENMTSSPQNLGSILMTEARTVLGSFPLARDGWTAGSAASALITDQGNVHTGICLDLACGIGFCAEHAAIAAMLKTRETDIEAIMAVNTTDVLPPCGRCREMMVQVSQRNWDTKVFLSDRHFVALRELLPHHWL
jgi:cytidine deaminase